MLLGHSKEKNPMAQGKDTTNLAGLLFRFMGMEDPMLSMLERLNKEIRRRTRVVGIFPNPESYLRLATVYLMEYSEDWSVTKAYLGEESFQSLTNRVA